MSYQSQNDIQPGSRIPGFNGVNWTVGSESGNKITVSAQLTVQGNPVTRRTLVHAYVSGSSNGDGVAAAAPTTVTVESGDQGHLIESRSSDNVLELQTDANGRVQPTLGEATAKTFYVVFADGNGNLHVSPAATFTT